MTVQALLVLSLVALSILYFGRSALLSLLGGSCAGGCSGCKAGCPARKLQAVEVRLNRKQ
jgi:hypothetical protein